MFVGIKAISFSFGEKEVLGAALFGLLVVSFVYLLAIYRVCVWARGLCVRWLTIFFVAVKFLCVDIMHLLVHTVTTLFIYKFFFYVFSYPGCV